MKLFLSYLSIFFVYHILGQTPINKILLGNIAIDSTNSPNIMGCGSYDYFKFQNKKTGLLNLSNNFAQQVHEILNSKKQTHSLNDIIEIPVVFHVVHNNNSVNIDDSVLHNQIKILNACYRRKNADTVNTRPIFSNIVGDSKIEFKLAQVDPNGNTTTGITRTYSNIEYFGGILPYGPGQNQQISNWVKDSLFYNYSRITVDSLGGKSAWDSNRYLNVWIGDLRILEPKFNDFKEIVYFAFATPPKNININWPDSILQFFNPYEQGVTIHYMNVGSNNLNMFLPPYNTYNGKATTGKILVHEVGHYFGLRHIWGDGDCSVDDFINDTPNSNAASTWNCDFSRNTCVDSFNGIDMPDMVENYMDYSNGNCQNSFTKGQIDFMRYVLSTFRTELVNVKKYNNVPSPEVLMYPNPTAGKFSIECKSNFTNTVVNIRSVLGEIIKQEHVCDNRKIDLELDYSNGIYFVEIISNNKCLTFKLLKQ